MNLQVVLKQHDQLSDQFEKQIALEQRFYANLDSIVFNLVVSYPLVLSYLKYSHIGINVNYSCVIISK